MYNNWFPLFSTLIAKDKLKKNNITTDPPELLLGLFPGFQLLPVHQLLMTNSVVDKAIATKQKDVANRNAAAAIQENSDFKDAIKSKVETLATNAEDPRTTKD